jgi:hypothetical protein
MARFLQQPLVRALLNLGNRAHVRYVRHIESRSKDDEDRVFIDAYAVTVELEHETVSFFVQVKATARLDKLTKQWSWEVSECKFLPGPPDDGPASAEAAV